MGKVTLYLWRVFFFGPQDDSVFLRLRLSFCRLHVFSSLRFSAVLFHQLDGRIRLVVWTEALKELSDFVHGTASDNLFSLVHVQKAVIRFMVPSDEIQSCFEI